MPVCVRIAPSPTGDPHVGTAYIALFNYAFARKNDGRFILRIEDTDRTRSTTVSEKMIFDSLRWLGLRWDEGPDVGGPHGPYRQSERSEIYREHVSLLVERGRAYRCFCSAERLEELRRGQVQAGGSSRYDGLCRGLDPAESAKRAAAGEPHVVRLAMPHEGTTSVQDCLRGAVIFDNALIDDQILLKSDGFPTYHLANVVDDHLMGVTHVIRAEEWLPSTPKHIELYDAFGWKEPEWIHLPLLRNTDRSKISKRKNPVSLNYYRRAGYLPEAMLNYIGLMGWSMPDGKEKFSLEEFVEGFDIARVSLGGPVFDLEKLRDLNGKYLRDMDGDRFLELVQSDVFSTQYLRRLIPLVRERIEVLEDFVAYTSFFFTGELGYAPEEREKLVAPKRTPGQTAEVLEKLVDRIDAQMEWDHAALESLLRGFCAEAGWKTKELFMPVRIAVTGRSATPPLFETMEVLGKEICRRRLRGAVALLRTMAETGAAERSAGPSVAATEVAKP